MCLGIGSNTCAILLLLMTGSTCFGDTDHLCGTETAQKDLIDFRVDRVEINSLGAKILNGHWLEINLSQSELWCSDSYSKR